MGLAIASVLPGLSFLNSWMLRNTCTSNVHASIHLTCTTCTAYKGIFDVANDFLKIQGSIFFQLTETIFHDSIIIM